METLHNTPQGEFPTSRAEQVVVCVNKHPTLCKPKEKLHKTQVQQTPQIATVSKNKNSTFQEFVSLMLSSYCPRISMLNMNEIGQAASEK